MNKCLECEKGIQQGLTYFRNNLVFDVKCLRDAKRYVNPIFGITECKPKKSCWPNRKGTCKFFKMKMRENGE